MCRICVMISGRQHQRPSSPMSTDSNMSPAITHKRPRRHKQNQSGQQGYQPKDVFNDGNEPTFRLKICYCVVSYNLTFGSLCSAVSPDSCMPLNFTSQMSHGEYKVRGATLPRMGSGEGRGRRGSTGTHRVREGTTEQRESQDKHKTPLGVKGGSKSRQHSGTILDELYCSLSTCSLANHKILTFSSLLQNLGTSFCIVVPLSHQVKLRGSLMIRIHPALYHVETLGPNREDRWHLQDKCRT